MACFRGDVDFTLYMGLLNELAPRFGCSVHAYVLMTNHVHLLVTPETVHGPSGLMKSLNQRFAQHFNKVHERSGTLWEGRFRSHVVDSETYFFTCSRYIELNPVRAGMVREPWQFPWSSHRANAGLEASLFLSAHPLYAALGTNDEERQQRYRALFQHPPSSSEIEAIRHCINSGSTLGCDSFVKKLEQALGRRGKARAKGRPKGQCSSPREKVSDPGVSEPADAGR